MTTYAAVATRTNTAIPPHLEAQAEIPVVTSGTQGDVTIIPTTVTSIKGTPEPLTGKGVNIVTSDVGRNRHILSGDGTFTRGTVTDPERDYGLLTVPSGGQAVVTHTEEHGSIAYPEGHYRVFGQFDPYTQARVAD